MDTTLLKIEHLQIAFQVESRRVQAIQDLTLSIERGKTVCLIGESGSGKSSVAHAILRLLPSNASCHGKIHFLGEEILSLPEAKMQSIRGKEAGMIFQEPLSALNPVQRIGLQVEEVLKVHSPLLTAEERRVKTLEMLRFTGFESPEVKYDLFPHMLSGGMRQRVVIAMALLMQPRLLVADEPTTALDTTIQAQILSLIKKLKVEKQMGVLFVTHDLGIVAEIADEVIVLLAGEVVERGSAAQILSRPNHPYTQALLNAIPTPSKRWQKLGSRHV